MLYQELDTLCEMARLAPDGDPMDRISPLYAGLMVVVQRFRSDLGLDRR